MLLSANPQMLVSLFRIVLPCFLKNGVPAFLRVLFVFYAICICFRNGLVPVLVRVSCLLRCDFALLLRKLSAVCSGVLFFLKYLGFAFMKA
jgi:hypothetical protein